MDNTKISDLEKEVIESLTIELRKESTFDASVLKNKVRDAIKEVKFLRRYENSSYSKEQIERDLYNYYSVIRKLALYDYNQIGAEFQKSHSENSINRTWEDREKITRNVDGFVKFLC